MMKGLTLGNKPLEWPRLIETDWSYGQKFSDSSDPDRMNTDFVDKYGNKGRYQLPGFVRDVNPAERSQSTTVTEIKPPSVYDDDYIARVVHDVFTDEECQELISSFNHKGFTPALVNTGGGRQTYLPDYRRGHRVIVDSPEFTQWLFQVLKPHLPEETSLLSDSKAKISDINERCRVLCYTPGQFFAEHCDGQYRRPPNHPKAGDCSAITLQMYLHDIPEENGGATTFLDPSYGNKHNKQAPVPCQPRRGSILLFSQDLLHEGSLVKAGIKYTIRSEVMYTPQGNR